jgi:hypothetical protein
MNSEALICPFCFSQFPENTYTEEVPVCRECRGYGRSILLELRNEFFQSANLQQIVGIKQTWLNRADFMEVERQMVLTNLDRLLIDLNENSDNH